VTKAPSTPQARPPSAHAEREETRAAGTDLLLRHSTVDGRPAPQRHQTRRPVPALGRNGRRTPTRSRLHGHGRSRPGHPGYPDASQARAATRRPAHRLTFGVPGPSACSKGSHKR
jgi:hypothetical protein